MGRPAVFSELYKTLKLIKEECPGFYFDVDIMVGFPGETKENFEELVEFFKNDKCFNKVKHFGYSDVKGSVSCNFENKLSQDEIAYRWSYLDKILGTRSYSEETNESRLHDETFKLTRFQDYSFCVNTFNEDIEEKFLKNEIINVEPVTSKDKGEFDFEL